MTGPTNTPLTPATFLRTNTIIHLALAAGQLLFGIIAFLKTANQYFDLKNTGDPLFFIVPMVAIGGFAVGNFLFKKALITIAVQDQLNEKLKVYQSALITRAAMLEGPSLFGIVCFMITGNLFFLAIPGVIVLYFLTLWPTKQKMENDLDLTYEEKMEFPG
ncbi:hypothetical protein BH09BAC6_BH09BAC6_28740 [soil metagenome]|jgi:hypothetical protein